MFESEFSFVSTAIVPTSDTISRGSFHVLNGVLVVVDVVSLVAAREALAIRSVKEDTLPTQDKTTMALDGLVDFEAAIDAALMEDTISAPGFNRQACAVNGPEKTSILSLSAEGITFSDAIVNGYIMSEVYR